MTCDKGYAEMRSQSEENADEAIHEIPDKNLENVVGGIDITNRLHAQKDDKPPIEAPILNPFS